MIVSHSHRFIFLHCRKVAGSSLKLGLYPVLAGSDIMIGSLHEALAAGYSPTLGIRSALATPRAKLVYFKHRLTGTGHAQSANNALKARFYGLSRNPPHATAEETARFFSSEWQNYRKVAFVRNPYTQIVSDYLWRAKNRPQSQVTFSRFLDLIQSGDAHPFLPNGYVPNWHLVSLQNKVAVDFVGRFERLAQDFDEMISFLGVTASLDRHEKKGERPSEYYQSMYGPGDRQKVAKIFEQELSTFSYDWPFGK